MKKYILFFSAIALLMPFFVLAQTDNTAQSNGITLKDLEVTNPGILPTSNLYFLKIFVRGIERAITFNSAKRAELELRITNEKAAEIKKLEETAADTKSLERAIESYKESTELLKSRFEALKENSENPNIDKLLDKLADRTLKHQQLFDELKAKNDELKNKIEDAEDNLGSAAADVVERLDSAEKLKERFKKAVENQREGNAKEIRAVGILNKIEKKIKNDEIKIKLSETKEELIKKFEDRVKNLPAEKTSKFEKEKAISKDEASKIINSAAALINELETKIKSYKTVPASIKSLLENAKTHLAKARASFETSKYGEAFGQANSSLSIARNAISQLLRANVNSEEKKETLPETSAPSAKKWNVEIKNRRFFPSELKIKKGDTVMWTNSDSSPAWPASAVHPTHQVYPGFDALKGLSKGESYSFTFDKVGSWKYHDHLNPSTTGVVVVSE